MTAPDIRRILGALRLDALLFFGCFASSALWLMWSHATHNPPPISLSIGFAAAGLILGGVRHWWAVALGMLFAFLFAEPSRPLSTHLMAMAAVTSGAVTTASLIRRRGIRPAEILDPKSLAWVLVAAVAGALAAAVVGTASAWAHGRLDSLAEAFSDRATRFGLGLMLAAPLVLVWATPARDSWRPVAWLSFLAAMLLCVVVAAFTYLSRDVGPIAWVVYPPLILAALMFHLRGAATAVAATAIIILWGTGMGFGPFALADPEYRPLMAQGFVAVTCATTLLLATFGDKRRAEAALSESEKRLRLAQEAAGVGVWEIDLVRGGSRHSHESARMFALPWREGEYRMADFTERLGEAQVAELRAAIRDAGSTRGPLELTLQLALPDGGTRWVHLHGSYDPHDGRPRLLGLAVDITHDVEAQAQLREAHDKLLRVARLSAMGAMASTLAHELNQPLSAITNYVETCRYLMRRKPEPDHTVIDALELARDQALRAGAIIRKIRAFTMSGEIARQSVDLEAVIQDACASMRRLKLAQGVTITCDLDPGFPPLLGDSVQLEQVVANLARNAIEATEGCPRREVAIRTQVREHEVLVEISDTGRGLADEMIENLFEPFRTTKESGTGLGLPICRAIVEAHGGRLWAENGPAGAMFSFTLPLASEAELAMV